MDKTFPQLMDEELGGDFSFNDANQVTVDEEVEEDPDRKSTEYISGLEDKFDPCA